MVLTMNTKDENKLSKSISAADDKANLDAACRSVLSDKYILAPILKDCIEEYKDCSIKDITTKYIGGTPQVGTDTVGVDETNRTIHGMSNEDKTLTESSVTYDIRFRALVSGTEDEKIELIIYIEAQNE